ARADGSTAIRLDDGYGGGLGKLSADAAASVQALRTGLSLASIKDKDIERLVRQLARRGLFEDRLAGSRGDTGVIEPQMPHCWAQAAQLGDADTLVLSRLAYLRRRGDEMVLDSPRVGALFRISDANVAAALALLSQPQPLKTLRRREGFPGLRLLALL